MFSWWEICCRDLTLVSINQALLYAALLTVSVSKTLSMKLRRTYCKWIVEYTFCPVWLLTVKFIKQLMHTVTMKTVSNLRVRRHSTVLPFTLRSSIHLESSIHLHIIFKYGVRHDKTFNSIFLSSRYPIDPASSNENFKFYFSPYRYLIYPAPYTENITLSLLHCLILLL